MVEKLAADTGYKFRVSARNAAGRSKWTEAKLNTAKPPPKPTPGPVPEEKKKKKKEPKQPEVAKPAKVAKVAMVAKVAPQAPKTAPKAVAAEINPAAADMLRWMNSDDTGAQQPYAAAKNKTKDKAKTRPTKQRPQQREPPSAAHAPASVSNANTKAVLQMTIKGHLRAMGIPEIAGEDEDIAFDLSECDYDEQRALDRVLSSRLQGTSAPAQRDYGDDGGGDFATVGKTGRQPVADVTMAEKIAMQRAHPQQQQQRRRQAAAAPPPTQSDAFAIPRFQPAPAPAPFVAPPDIGGNSPWASQNSLADDGDFADGIFMPANSETPADASLPGFAFNQFHSSGGLDIGGGRAPPSSAHGLGSLGDLGGFSSFGQPDTGAAVGMPGSFTLAASAFMSSVRQLRHCFGTISRGFIRSVPPHTRAGRAALLSAHVDVDWMLIFACNPMLCPLSGFRPHRSTRTTASPRRCRSYSPPISSTRSSRNSSSWHRPRTTASLTGPSRPRAR